MTCMLSSPQVVSKYFSPLAKNFYDILKDAQ
jgi:hypothetical protein